MAGPWSSCFFCGGQGRPGATCKRCLLPLPDPDASDPPISPRCPRCRAAFRAVDGPGAPTLRACRRCGGAFVTARAWCILLARPDLALTVERSLPAPSRSSARAGSSSSAELVLCAACGTQMDRGRFAASSGVVVDVCARHGVWLDHGELGRIAEYVRSPSRPVDDGPASTSSTAPLREALEQERIRIEALASSASRTAPARPIWLKVLPLGLLLLGVAARWYYLQRAATAAAEQGVDITLEGKAVRRAGQEGSDVLGR